MACLKYEQGDRAAGHDVKGDADLTLRHLELGAVRIALVGGLHGTGKTTVAGALADAAELPITERRDLCSVLLPT